MENNFGYVEGDKPEDFKIKIEYDEPVVTDKVEEVLSSQEIAQLEMEREEAIKRQRAKIEML